MPKTLVHLSFLFLALTGFSGLWMRLISLDPSLAIFPYANILHAHSHIAVLGWTFLAVYCIILKLIWHNLKQKKQGLLIGMLTFLITILMFFAFLFQGYAVFSIVFSTLHIVMEYWAAIFIYKQINQQKNHFPKSFLLFMKGALLSLVISSIGPFALGGLSSMGLKETPFFDMSIYFYLHFQYNGWLYLSLIGLFVLILHRKGVNLESKWLTRSFWIYTAFLLPAYILSILWYHVGWFGYLLAVIGAFGQLIAIVLLLFVFIQNKEIIQTIFSRHILISLLFTFGLLMSKSIMEFGLLYKPLAVMVFDTRSVIIGYLHLTLLGFISIFILTQFQMTNILDETNKNVLFGVGIFILGFTLNEFVLFTLGLTTWLHQSYFFQNELLTAATIFLIIGILMIWSSMKQNRIKL